MHARIADALRHAHARSSRQGHVAFARKDRLASEVHGDQGGRAGGLHVDARAGKVELVGNSSARKILVVAEVRETAGVAGQICAERQSIDEVTAHHSAQPRENADWPSRATHQLPGVLERLPRHLQKQPLLGIHESRFLGRILEEGSVELIDIRKQRGGLHVRRITQRLGRDTRRQQLLVAQCADRFDATTEILPKGRLIGGTRKAAGDTDDSDACGAVPAGHLGFLRACLVRARSTPAAIAPSSPPRRSSGKNAC